MESHPLSESQMSVQVSKALGVPDVNMLSKGRLVRVMYAFAERLEIVSNKCTELATELYCLDPTHKGFSTLTIVQRTQLESERQKRLRLAERERKHNMWFRRLVRWVQTLADRSVV